MQPTANVLCNHLCPVCVPLSAQAPVTSALDTLPLSCLCDSVSVCVLAQVPIRVEVEKRVPVYVDKIVERQVPVPVPVPGPPMMIDRPVRTRATKTPPAPTHHNTTPPTHHTAPHSTGPRTTARMCTRMRLPGLGPAGTLHQHITMAQVRHMEAARTDEHVQALDGPDAHAHMCITSSVCDWLHSTHTHTLSWSRQHRVLQHTHGHHCRTLCIKYIAARGCRQHCEEALSWLEEAVQLVASVAQSRCEPLPPPQLPQLRPAASSKGSSSWRQQQQQLTAEAVAAGSSSSSNSSRGRSSWQQQQQGQGRVVSALAACALGVLAGGCGCVLVFLLGGVHLGLCLWGLGVALLSTPMLTAPLPPLLLHSQGLLDPSMIC